MKIEERISVFVKALESFNEGLLEEPSELERDGAIQRFEYCYELCWKTLKLVVQDQGMTDARGPKEVFRQAFMLKIIDDESIWLAILQSRNLTVHTYNKELAENLYANLPRYYNAMGNLRRKLFELYMQ